MREYTVGHKAAAVVLHQLFTVVTVTSVFAADYCMQRHMKECAAWSSLTAILALAVSFVLLAYLTNVTGRKSDQDSKIYYRMIDYIYSDILILMFCVVIIIMAGNIRHVKLHQFRFASLMIASGTLAYLFDLVFLTLYQSIVRKMKGNLFMIHSLMYQIYEFLRQYIRKKEFKKCFRREREREQIQQAIELIASGALDTTLEAEQFHGQEKKMAQAVNHIRDGLKEAVLESIKNERMKADLITNVSHDIKTPLTSIVNYVELLKRENLENERVQNYIRIIDEKSQRLKHLTEDLVEASRISSGNIRLDMQQIDFVELLYQTGGEFNEKFEQRELTIITKLPNKSVFIYADGRQLYRTIENLYTNAAKYALEKTRVYVQLEEKDGYAVFSMKNISKTMIPMDGDQHTDLTERFVRGDASRTTEGSGLGLSIAKNLTNLMNGTFEIKVDGDLFIVLISYKMA